MYWKLKAGEDRFIWDDEKNEMYQVWDGVADKIQPSLMMLSKFRVDLELDGKVGKKPIAITSYEDNTRKHLLGK